MAVTSTSPNSLSSDRKRRIAAGFFIGGIAAVCIFMVFHTEYLIRFQQYGYVGLFVITLATGVSVLAPGPYMLLTFTLGGVLHPALVGTVAGAGLSTGGTLIYLTGRGGRRFFPQFNPANLTSDDPDSRMSRFMKRIKLPRVMNFAHRRGAVAVFALSVAPNPFFVPMAISMGAMRFRLPKFFFACLAGQVTKAIIIAYCGYWGLGSFLRWLGVLGVS
ncbi:MAG: VTT domain-containing protein [Dehalococcoidales bacterium]|nr:VTT domain-containing protein [Dehalococcoidales bacterium]